MKKKLLKLGLPQDVANIIMDEFDTYQRMVKRHSKPTGKIAIHNNLLEIEKLSKTLEKKLSNITLMEQQFIQRFCYPDIFKIRQSLTLLSFSCSKTREMNVRFSRREPFMLDLTVAIWRALESHGIAVKKYKNSMLCKVLNTLFPESEKPRRHRVDESEAPEDLWAFHLQREAGKYISKS